MRIPRVISWRKSLVELEGTAGKASNGGTTRVPINGGGISEFEAVNAGAESLSQTLKREKDLNFDVAMGTGQTQNETYPNPTDTKTSSTLLELDKAKKHSTQNYYYFFG